MRCDVLAVINEAVREEKGTRVDETSTLRDANLDSFGITMLFCELDATYAYFSKMGNVKDPFAVIPYDTITIKEIIDTCLLESTNI